MKPSTRALSLLAAVLVLALLDAGVAGADGDVPLPVRKVMLYRNGMGYFEHLGEVTGKEPVEIVLPARQLDDVLKSLTVIDLAPAPVVGVTYDSTVPLERQLAELPVKLGTVQGVVGFLNQVRGTEVELHVPGGPIVGRVLGADVRRKEVGQAGTVEVAEVTVFSAAGEVRTVELPSAKMLRLREPELAADVQRYLQLLGAGHRQDVRRLRISTLGQGTRKLFVGYTSEAPIWKTTYRLVLDSARKPLLQGWAIVDNTTAMDWSDVEMSLVAGAPISFVQRLSQPLYGKRPVVPLPEGVQAAPQTHEATLQAPRTAAAPPPPAAAMRPLSPSAAERSQVQALMALPEAEPAKGQMVGEQFEYRIPHAVTIRRNQSAMLPIVQAQVEAEKVAIWRARDREAHPRVAVWLTNTSGLTLAPGAFTIIDSGSFAGEGLAETIQPGERRLLSYGLDLGIEVAVREPRELERVERVVIQGGVMRSHVRHVGEITYVVRNHTARPRTVIVEHPASPDYALAAGQSPVESTATFHRFRIAAGPKSTAELTVRVEKPDESTVAIDTLSRDRITAWLRERRIDATVERALARVVERLEEVQELKRRAASADDETRRIFRDQERLRENLGKLGQGPDEAGLRLRYLRQLEEQEKRLEELRAEQTRLEAEQAAADRRLRDQVKDLAIDQRL